MKKLFLGSLLVISSTAVGNAPHPQVGRSVIKLSEMDLRLQRDRNMVLEKKNEIEGHVQVGIPSEAERKLYEELVRAYERNDELTFQSRFQGMMTNFPRSLLADDSLYLAGMLSFSNRQYSRAIKHFAKILTEYPRSNRARAALFAKAAAYRKMNLQPQAVSVFNEVRKTYPGSPEAKRADVELRIVK